MGEAEMSQSSAMYSQSSGRHKSFSTVEPQTLSPTERALMRSGSLRDKDRLVFAKQFDDSDTTTWGPLSRTEPGSKLQQVSAKGTFLNVIAVLTPLP